MNVTALKAPTPLAAAAPAPGQATLPGLRLLDGEIDDARPAIAMDVDAAGLYALPMTTRSGMISEMMSRPLDALGDRLFLSWDIRMDFPWDRSGAGAHEVSQEYDARWKDLLEEDVAVFHQACENALRPWLDTDVDLFDLDGELTCSFDLLEPGRDRILLREFRGAAMGFPGRAAYEDFLHDLDDLTLGRLWMACRILDTDFGRQARAEVMGVELNEIRARLEEDWSVEVDHLSF